jgi:SAM-dependent methyltransferase
VVNTPRFGRLKEDYVAYRPGFPDALYRLLAESLGTPRQRAVDLGAGTGLATAPLCAWFAEVIAVEPDAEMARELGRAVPQARVLVVRAEELPEDLGPVDLVTAANAFYWMDGPVVAEKVARVLRPGGLFAVYRTLPNAPGPVQAIVAQEYAAHWDQFRHPRLLDEEYSRRVVASAGGFRDVTLHTVPYEAEFDARRFVGLVRSTSFGSAYLRTLADPEGYLADLERRIREAAGEKSFRLDLPVELVLARR